MARFDGRVFVAVALGSTLAGAILVLPGHREPEAAPTAFKLRGKDHNPDAFYSSATGETISYGFNYDPHAADDWMFRTAEGSLEKQVEARRVLLIGRK